MPCFSQVNFSSLSNDNSNSSDDDREKEYTDNVDEAVQCKVTVLARYTVWWYCKPQEQNSAPVSSDPHAGMFLYYNFGFPAIPF